MWFRKVSYSRLQSYAIPYMTEFFYAGSAILLAILVTVNVALFGYDVVTELKDTPDFIDTKWWAPKWVPDSMKIPTTPGPCQPLTLPKQSSSIRTNSSLSLFSYTLTNGLGTFSNANRVEEPRWYNAPHYRAEPLKNCIIQNITALINFQNRGHKLTSQIVCDISSTDPQTPPSLKLSTTFSRTANTDLDSDDVISYISSYAIPQSASIGRAQAVYLAQNVTALKILGVLDAIGSDLLKAMWAQKWAWTLTGRNNQWPDQAVVKWAAKANCTSWGKCREIGEGIEGIDMWYSDTRGLQDFDPDYLTPMNTTIYNYFVAFRDAIYLDLGHLDRSANVFLSDDVFKTHILPDPFLGTIAGDVINIARPPPTTRPYSSQEFWSTCTWGWGCVNGTWSDAVLNQSPAALNITNGLPLSSPQNQYPTIIDSKFVCPIFRRKHTGALVISVFVGTFSMYAVIYVIFLFFAPLFDQIYRRRHGLREVLYEVEDYETTRSRYPPYLSPGLTSPYATSFDAPHMRYNSSAPIQQYNPTPDYVFVRPKRKGDELPPGACTPCAPGVFKPKPEAGVLASVSHSSQPSLNQTTSRDTANSSRVVRSSSEQDRLTLSPPRAVVQTSRGFQSPQTAREPYHSEYK
ncbi:hypothetical protein B0J17DRAFT_768718 [Rhizoctonia solani]|nr:hypothetical protein B0J17DRAFT_768718 [Rhizoctonia solani]